MPLTYILSHSHSSPTAWVRLRSWKQKGLRGGEGWGKWEREERGEGTRGAGEGGALWSGFWANPGVIAGSACGLAGLAPAGGGGLGVFSAGFHGSSLLRG